MDALVPYAPITALLGPTNTGKTHRAVERMLEHASGTIGLPLRLLAREVYERISARVGERSVALITGEEKRVPSAPRYCVATVEAMPLEREVDFLAIDEIQLVAHPERGHVFTSRLLDARGRRETWLLGSETARPLVERLVPTAKITGNARLSRLSGAGSWTLRSLPPRSAVVGFSTPQIYELAGRLRQARGGAAVVLGALSPRTRNAQVAMYQAGEVDYLVATDAIGMGLNLDVEQIAFAATTKFDGRETRPLEVAELAQIAGRAGRHLRDGRFGTLAPQPALPPALVVAIEEHRFAPLRFAYWRATELETSSIDGLIASLLARPPRPELRAVERASDLEVLRHLARQSAIRARASSAESVARLWAACQIPDYQRSLVEHHGRLVARVFMDLVGSRGQVAPEWMEGNLTRLDRTGGDIDTLMLRLELVRTFAYIGHHPGWVEPGDAWPERTEAVEARLSDALHQRLVERFVEAGRAPGPRARRRPRRAPLSGGEAAVPDGHPFAKLLTLQLGVAPAPEPTASDAWVHELVDAPHDRFELDRVGRLGADGRVLAQLTRGSDRLRPELRLLLGEGVGAGARARLQRRLIAWTRDRVAELLAPLRGGDATRLGGAARGLLYQLEQGLGTVATATAAGELAHLSAEDRAWLAARGVVLGQRYVFARGLLRPRAVTTRGALVRAHLGATELVPEPPPGAFSLPRAAGIADETYLALGYPRLGPRAVRADAVERVVAALTAAVTAGEPVPTSRLGGWLGCSGQQAERVVEALGLDAVRPARRPRARRRAPPRAGE